MPPPPPGDLPAEIKLTVAEGSIVKPGDTLVLVTSRSLNEAEMAAMREDVAKRMPGVALAIVEGFDQALVYRPGEVTHRCPLKGEGITPCCGRTPLELPVTDRLTLDDALVTCSRATDG